MGTYRALQRSVHTCNNWSTKQCCRCVGSQRALHASHENCRACLDDRGIEYVPACLLVVSCCGLCVSWIHPGPMPVKRPYKVWIGSLFGSFQGLLNGWRAVLEHFGGGLGSGDFVRQVRSKVR